MARTHKTTQIKAKMPEQERVAEEARQTNLALLRAARMRSERTLARDIMDTSCAGSTEVAEDSEAQDRAEDATEGTSDEEGGDGEAQVCVDTPSEAKKTTDDEEDASGEDEEDGEEEQVASNEKGDDKADESEELVQAPAFKAQHDSWSSLEQPLKKYMETTHQNIVVTEVINVARSNAALRRQVRYQGLTDSELPLVPAKMEPYQSKFICIRQVPADSPLIPDIELLVEAEAGTTSVYNYIRENTNHRVTMDDVHNLLRRLLKQSKCLEMREVEVFLKKLPKDRALYCHFHGVYDEDVLAQMKHAITNMTYSITEEDYQMHREEFKILACQDDRTKLWEYFDKNWDDCCEIWVMAYRVDLPHFGNHINNRLESALDNQRRKEEEYRSKVEMPGALRDVAAAIKTQYDVATDAAVVNNDTFSNNGTTVSVSGGEREYLLKKEGYLCDSGFAQTMELPCRHARMYKMSSDNPFIIPFSTIAPTYFGQSWLSQQELTEVAAPFVAKIYKDHLQAADGRLSIAKKYSQAQQALSRISGELARFEDDAFASAMSQLD
ncbi:hypothetical protein F442_04183 [Phytophthora nicotianae P10297]|uniref:Uncharacterized protein n=1 Tax=Phytophthora nicotianae P10297 TaxID=1317064 RepID=W2ZU39_PHYNI|nr:hypothetical protein F442_04183 [Phytophthora nicotianae P10297]